MDIKGQVTNKTAILDLLRDIFESAETGVFVVVDSSGVERRLFFEDGAIVSAASTAPDESLGCLLVEKAIIHEHHLKSAEEQDRDNTKLLGQRLVDLGAVSEEEIGIAVRLKVKRTIQDILASQGGKVSFVKERLPDKGRVLASVDSGLLSSSVGGALEDNPSPSTPEGESHAERWLETSTAKLESPAEAEEDSSPALSGSAKPSEAPDAQTAPHGHPLGISLLAGGVLVAIIVLLSAGYWFYSQTASREATEDQDDLPEPSAVTGVEPPPVTIPPDAGRRDTIEAAGAERADTNQGPVVRPSDSEQIDVEKIPEKPLSASSPERRMERRTVTPEPPLEAEVAAEAGPELAEAPAVVEEDLGSPSGGDRTEPTSEVDQEEPAPSEVESAASAPKAIDPPAGKPEVQPGDLVEPADDVIDPVLLELPALHYPKEAKRRKLDAVVRVRVLVAEQGNVLKAELQEPVGHGFDSAALSVAARSRFIPATKGTVPVKMWTVLPIVYRFQKE